MASYTDLAKGLIIRYKGAPHVVDFYQHYKPGKGPAFVRTKLRNLITGSVLEEIFRGGDTVEFAQVERHTLQYLYQSAQEYNFMRTDTYEQISLPHDLMVDAMRFVSEGQEVIGLFFEGKVAAIDVPKKVILTVTLAGEGARGDTASGSAYKEVEIETGATVQVPIFIRQGEKIVVNTETGEYVGRA